MEKLPNVHALLRSAQIWNPHSPQNHLEHATSASVHKAKANDSTCTKDMVEPKGDTNLKDSS